MDAIKPSKFRAKPVVFTNSEPALSTANIILNVDSATFDKIEMPTFKGLNTSLKPLARPLSPLGSFASPPNSTIFPINLLLDFERSPIFVAMSSKNGFDFFNASLYAGPRSSISSLYF